eukprot:m.151004 g.151004  ORF g.151004 m.151004 type:complete len:95 (-) comp16190_c1_seq1:123-407(-)
MICRSTWSSRSISAFCNFLSYVFCKKQRRILNYAYYDEDALFWRYLALFVHLFPSVLSHASCFSRWFHSWQREARAVQVVDSGYFVMLVVEDCS